MHRNLLFPNTTSPSASKREEQPLPIQLALLPQPALRLERVGARKHRLVDAVRRVRLHAYYGAAREVIPVDRAAARGHVAREGHRDGREAAQALGDDGVEVGKLVEGRVRVGAEFRLQAPLDVQRAGLRDLPHQEAQRVARGVDTRRHVVEALGRHVELFHPVVIVLHPAEQGELRGAGLCARGHD